MKTPIPADLQRWSEELARNPASLAFLPLARAYRKLGRRDLAMRLVVRGLEAHPANVEAHALLALLYLEEGDRAHAADEWSIVLRLKPGNFEALRGMGFRYLEQNDIPKARQHLERAALIRPDDLAVQEALRLLDQREATLGPPARPAVVEAAKEELAPPEAASAAEDAPLEWSPYADEPAAVTPITPPSPPPALQALQERPAPAPAAKPEPAERPAGPRPADDPEHVFDDLLRTGPLLGALLLDARGLVLAGTVRNGHAEGVGAVIGAAVDEAVRTVQFLELGQWKSLLLECDAAMLHVGPIADQGIVLLAAEPGAPMGWVLRTASSLAERAARLLEVPA